ncbi:BZ3500_MvSof-1268-A1-R1_Chr7-3g09671 [Microbotryum saponariae]|uniref:Transcription initiation factor TFIID subunit 4 n=1 Tax=Microbotryum saponariae TaxID=289078 RepID=A0A2X0M080_9BASI|nr:BZ3501_MvSof-1269-A2-R1_Chr7-2g09394 [Microbotryum saponariae]SDA02385.1 BZ3500_MvSof-1268-A1-R1_Chr7-3g09671 [Microbotryum saponariae]
MPPASSPPPPSSLSQATVSTPTASTSVSTPKPAGGGVGGGGAGAGGGGGLQLPGGGIGNKGKAKANPSAETSRTFQGIIIRNTTRATSKEPHEPNTNTSMTTGGGNSKSEHEGSTNVQDLMDAVGASGVDINAEEDSLRQHRPVGSHSNPTSTSHPNPSTTHTTTTTSAPSAPAAPSTSTLTELDQRIHSQSFIEPQVLADVVRKIAAEYSLKSLEGQTIPLIALACRTRLMDLISNSISVRDHRLGAHHLREPPFGHALKRRRIDRTLGEGEEEEQHGGVGEDEVLEGEKEPVWDAVVYDEPEKALWVLEKVDREEERRRRRERVLRDEKEQEEKELREAVEASERAREEQERGPEGLSTPGLDRTDQTTTTTNTLGSTTAGMETPKSNPLLKKKKKRELGQAAIAKNLSGDVQKRLTDQIAMRSLGGRSFSWLSGAGAAGGGSTMSTPNRPHTQSAIGTPTLGTTPTAGSSSLNPFPSSLNRLTTIPSLHDANRQKLDAEESWRQGAHVVELKDLLFALDNQRGMGAGKGAGKVASLKARAGVVRKA